MMLYWMKNGRFYMTQADAPIGAQPECVPEEKAERMAYLKHLSERLLTSDTVVHSHSEERSDYARGFPPQLQTDEERMEMAIARPRNLDTYEYESATDFLHKIRRGNFHPSSRQANLMDKIYDKALRRSNFRNLPDYHRE